MKIMNKENENLVQPSAIILKKANEYMGDPLEITSVICRKIISTKILKNTVVGGRYTA